VPAPSVDTGDAGDDRGPAHGPGHHRHAWHARQLVVLGTAAQSPTVRRNQNGHVVRWGPELVLFDPGEGTQRQLVRAGVQVGQLTRICITHAHGDHCLGLAGVLQRRSLDPSPAPIDIHVPASMVPVVVAALASSAWEPDALEVRVHPTRDGDEIRLTGDATLSARSLDHTIDTLGWRLALPTARHFVPALLAERGVPERETTRLRRDGVWRAPDGTSVRLDDVSVVEPGAAFAFVMDTRPCATAVDLARGAQLAVFEATYLDTEGEAPLADAHGHLTARAAATLAREAGVARLVLAHYSERHPDEALVAAEAAAVHADVVAAHDLDVIDPPPWPAASRPTARP
jgi:ribonuclease Z